SPWQRGARHGSRLPRCHEAREEAHAAAEAAQSGGALAAPAQGRRARKDYGREPAAGENRARADAAPRRMKQPSRADVLCRTDLELGRMREIYLAAVDAGRALNDEQLSASLTSTLALRPKGAGWWVFAYGSLLWSPLFPVAEMRPATLRGLHRRFCLWSLATRGTPEKPGLVLGLERGGTCRGVVLRLQ